MREGNVERELREHLHRCRRLLSEEFMNGHGVEMWQIKHLRRCRRQLHQELRRGQREVQPTCRRQLLKEFK
jgi:hypothetical protein